ncbi:MAG: DUF507 family protein [Deltaproteobacteria bacterium]|nr:DUF507 family protein [Deltaproteobacteria bacterium]
MENLNEARIEAMALAVAKAIKAAPGVEILDNGGAVKRVAARLQSALSEDGLALDYAVRARIASLSRTVPEGSREWDLLYRQYSEQLAKHR